MAHVNLISQTNMYRSANKGVYVLLSSTQAGPGRTAKQEQEEISRNHVHTFICLSVHYHILHHPLYLSAAKKGGGDFCEVNSGARQLAANVGKIIASNRSFRKGQQFDGRSFLSCS